MNMLTKPLSKVLCFSLFLVSPLYAASIETELIHFFPKHLQIPPKMPLDFETHFKVLSIASTRINSLNNSLNIPLSDELIAYSYQGFLELYLLNLFEEKSIQSQMHTPDLQIFIENFKKLSKAKRFTLAALYYANHLNFFLTEYSNSFPNDKDFWRFFVETLKKDAQTIWDSLSLEYVATFQDGCIKDIRADLESYVDALFKIQAITQNIASYL